MPLPKFETLDGAKRKRIITAAAEAVAEEGIEGASLNRILKAAQISKGAFYYYFADRDDLIRTTLAEALTLWVTEVGLPSEVTSVQAFWTECRATYVRSLRFMLADRLNGQLCLAVVRLRREQGSHPLVAPLLATTHQWMGALLEQGRALGAIRSDVPLELLLQMSIAVMDGGDRWLTDRWGSFGEADVEPTATLMNDFFRRIGTP